MSRGSLSFCKGKKNQECYLVTNWGLFDKISYILYFTEVKGQFPKAESSIGGLPKAGGGIFSKAKISLGRLAKAGAYF